MVKTETENTKGSAETPDKPVKNDKYFSKVVGKALDILELIKRSPVPLPLSEITSHIGMAKSSVFRILHTLEVAGYLHKNESGQYSLSTQARPWVSRYLVEELIETARPKMWELRRKYSETVSLGVLFDNHIEVVAVLESPRLIRMGNTVGRIIPPHASSLGKAICAFQPEVRCEELLRSYGLHRFSEKTITDEIELKKEFEKIRQKGWSLDNEESTEKGYCFGVPITVGSEVLAALSVSVPESRIPKGSTRKEIVSALKNVAAEIHRELGQRSMTMGVVT